MRKAVISAAAILLGLGLWLGTGGTAKAQDALEYGAIASHSTSGITGFARRGGTRNLFGATNNRLSGAMRGRTGMRGRLRSNKSRFSNSVSRTKYAGLMSKSSLENRRKFTGQTCETIEAGVRVMRPRCR